MMHGVDQIVIHLQEYLQHVIQNLMKLKCVYVRVVKVHLKVNLAKVTDHVLANQVEKESKTAGVPKPVIQKPELMLPVIMKQAVHSDYVNVKTVKKVMIVMPTLKMMKKKMTKKKKKSKKKKTMKKKKEMMT
jgi:hypothetical protein